MPMAILINNIILQDIVIVCLRLKTRWICNGNIYIFVIDSVYVCKERIKCIHTLDTGTDESCGLHCRYQNVYFNLSTVKSAMLKLIEHTRTEYFQPKVTLPNIYSISGEANPMIRHNNCVKGNRWQKASDLHVHQSIQVDICMCQYLSVYDWIANSSMNKNYCLLRFRTYYITIQLN